MANNNLRCVLCLGGKSNSGEGGEDPLRFNPINDVDAEGKSATFPHLKGLLQGDVATSRIKQIASGVFCFLAPISFSCFSCHFLIYI